MFKTFYGLAFKHYFINSETLELYRNKYISNIVYGWFLVVSVDGGATWEEVKHVSSGILEIRYKNYLIGLISDVEESKEIKQGAYDSPKTQSPISNKSQIFTTNSYLKSLLNHITNSIFITKYNTLLFYFKY